MTQEEAKIYLKVGCTYQSPYSGALFKMLPESEVQSDYVKNVDRVNEHGEPLKDMGFCPYYKYNGKIAIEVHTVTKELPIFN